MVLFGLFGYVCLVGLLFVNSAAIVFGGLRFAAE